MVLLVCWKNMLFVIQNVSYFKHFFVKVFGSLLEMPKQISFYQIWASWFVSNFVDSGSVFYTSSPSVLYNFWKILIVFFVHYCAACGKLLSSVCEVFFFYIFFILLFTIYIPFVIFWDIFSMCLYVLYYT